MVSEIFQNRISEFYMDNNKILEFTYAVYPVDSPVIGIGMVFLSFLPHIAAIVTCTLIVAQRSVHHLYFLFGLVLSHESAKLLKRLCAQPRPQGIVTKPTLLMYFYRCIFD